MRNSTKERLKLLAAVVILAPLGLVVLHQLYSTAVDGLVLWPTRRRGELITWISYEIHPTGYFRSLIAYGLVALLFLFFLAAFIASIYRKDRWRSRQFIDHAIRRRADTET